MRWPTDTGLATTAASAQKPRMLQSHLAERRRDSVRLPVFHAACLATRPAVRPKRRMDGGLIGDNLLLNLHQQLLCFAQRDTQVGNIAKTIAG